MWIISSQNEWLAGRLLNFPFIADSTPEASLPYSRLRTAQPTGQSTDILHGSHPAGDDTFRAHLGIFRLSQGSHAALARSRRATGVGRGPPGE
jgi:hypothetical protein